LARRKIPFPLGTGSYENESKPFSSQRCVNMYAGIAAEKSLNDVALFPSPGISLFTTVGVVKSRGATVMDGLYYVVLGTVLYSIDSDAVSTSRGTIAGTARVSTAHNGEKLCIVVPGGNSYVYNVTTTTLTQITDSDFRTSDTVVVKDGFYIFTATGTNIFFNSSLNDPLTFAALDFGTAEISPGDIVGSHVKHDELYIFKRDATEIFQNIGTGSGFQFERIQGASYEKGSHSKYGPIQWEGSLFFIGGGVNENAADISSSANF